MMLDFGTAVRRYYANYVNANGRAQRSAYWWVLLYQLIIYAVLATVVYMADGRSEFFDAINQAIESGDPNSMDPDVVLGASGLIAFFLMFIFALSNFLPDIMLDIRRCHDLGQSGWLVLGFRILGALPSIGVIVVLGKLVWFTFPGNPNSNQYGPDPLEQDTNIFG